MILNTSTLPLGPYVVPYRVGYLEIILFNYLFTWLRLAFTVAHGLSLTVSRGLSSCGTQAQPPRGLRNLPGAGTEPVSPAGAGGFSPTVPPGKSIIIFLLAGFLCRTQRTTLEMIFPVSSDLFLAQGHRIIASSEVALLIVLSDTPKSQGQSWERLPLVSSPGPGPLPCSCKELQLLLEYVLHPLGQKNLPQASPQYPLCQRDALSWFPLWSSPICRLAKVPV